MLSSVTSAWWRLSANPRSQYAGISLEPVRITLMFCLQCGTQNSLDSKFCKQCGERVAATREDIRQHQSPESAAIASEVDPVERVNPQIQRLLEMAFWHNQTGNASGAIVACEAALVVDPDSTTALSLLGCSYERQGEIQKAIYAFERVLELNPESEADQEKLSALKRGQFLTPIVQPIRYRWLPPAMVGLVSSGQGVHLAVACVAGLIVFMIGIAMVRPHDAGAPMQASGPALTGFTTEAQPASTSGTTEPIATMSNAPVKQAVGTYATIPAINQPAYAAPAPPPQSSRTPSRDVEDQAPLDSRSGIEGARRSLLRGVPPLTVAADADPSVPTMGSVKPLPVPSEQAQEAVRVESVASMPQHTVMVGGAGAESATEGGQSSAQGSPDSSDDGPPAPVTRISVHVHSLNDDSVAQSPNLLPSSPSDGFTGSARTHVSAGSNLQQKALQLQQQGDYRAAAKEYASAISAFKRDAENGQGVDEARRGIDACETGMQICQQSQ